MELSDVTLNGLPTQDGFRLRGIQVTRLETFIDAAFAFATTMLVISVGEIPSNYPEFILALKQVPAFLASFFVVMLFWTAHRTWSRRYGLEDTPTVLISVSFVFVLLVYIYPLRLMFSALFGWISGEWLPSRFTLTHRDELVGLFIIYGVGLTAIAGLMALLYFRAKAAKDDLSLNELEICKTNTEIAALCVVALTGLASALFSWLMPPNINLLGGFTYITMPIIIPLVERYYKRKEKRARALLDAEH